MDHAFQPTQVPGYQDGGQAWDPSRPDVEDLLLSAEHRENHAIYQGSNHTFLVVLECGEAGQSLAIYKPARGEYPLYDFPRGTLYRREVAASLLDNVLGWSIVPPTVVSTGRFGTGSLQLFIESPEEAEVDIEQIRRIAVLDALINNADRKADHCLPGLDGKLWAIDHGLTFHAQLKMRTVLWHFAGSGLHETEREELQQGLDRLCQGTDPHVGQLRELISGAEWRALLNRTQRMLDTNRLPNPRYKPVPYRW